MSNPKKYAQLIEFLTIADIDFDVSTDEEMAIAVSIRHPLEEGGEITGSTRTVFVFPYDNLKRVEHYTDFDLELYSGQPNH